MNSSIDLDLHLDSSSLNLPNLEKASDDDIEKLLKTMENLLSPNDQSVFDSNGNRSVGDILKAAEDLIHSSSPLFDALSPTDSQKSSGTSQNISSKSFKIDIPQLPLYNNSLSLNSNSTRDKKPSENENQEAPNVIIPSKPTNISSDINKEQTNIETEPKQDFNQTENVEGKNINENNINKVFQLKDIVNVQDKLRNHPKIYTKYDKHRQLNIKQDVDRKVKPSQTATKQKLDNNRMKSKDTERVKNALKSAENSNINTGDDNADFRIDKIKKPMLGIKLDSLSGEGKNGNLTSLKTVNLCMQSKETTSDITSDIHSLTRTLSPSKENLVSEPINNNMAIKSWKQELKMSDLTTPAKETFSVEEELELQRNKVRQLKEELHNTVKSHLHQLESMKIAHEEELVLTKRHMRFQQEVELKRKLTARTPGTDKATTPLDDHLLSSYDKENKKLCQEIKTLKAEFRDAESKWLEERSKLVLQLDQDETDSLRKQLRDAKSTIRNLEQTIHLLKAKNQDGDESDVIQKLEHQNFQLMNEICELTKKINDGNARSEDVVQSKEAEISRLQNELTQCKANSSSEETSSVRGLKAQLSEERSQLKSVETEKEVLAKDNYDLRRQVKELEIIVKKRNTTGCLTITGQEFFPETEKIKHLELQLIEKDKLIEKLTEDLDNLGVKYKTNITQLETQLKSEAEKVKIECEKLRKLKADHAKEMEDSKKKSKKSNVKEDAHLLATIRGLQSELLIKEKMLSKVNKELDDAKKTNKTLQKEREKILSSKNDSKHSSTQSLKAAGTLPSPEAAAEIAQLQLRVKELEDDIVTLHEKAAHDMETLRELHSRELAAKSSQGNVAELERQIYTQEIIISHLKQKLLHVETLQNNQALLKLENEHLASQLNESHSIISKLRELPSHAETTPCQSVLSKMDLLDKRQEVREREKTLQAIIHELLSDKKLSPSPTCMGDCQSKLLDKNREICYYRAEMDRILDSLREFKQSH